VPKTVVQVWHADETGAYDTAGYKLKGYHSTPMSWARC